MLCWVKAESKKEMLNKGPVFLSHLFHSSLGKCQPLFMQPLFDVVFCSSRNIQMTICIGQRMFELVFLYAYILAVYRTNLGIFKMSILFNGENNTAVCHWIWFFFFGGVVLYKSHTHFWALFILELQLNI